MATNGWIGEQTVHSWGKYNSRLTTNVYINGIRRYSDHIDVSGVIYLFCKSSGARTVWYDWAITAWCGGRNLGLIKSRTYNNNILGKSWSKNFSIRINCSNSATSATFQVGFSDSNMGGKDKYWTLYFDRYATSPSGITSVAGYTQYSTISTSCSGINWGQGYSSRKLTCTASYTYNGKTENFTLGTWTDGATSKSVTKTDFNFPADLNVTVKWTASTNIGSTSSTAQIKVKQTFPAPNLNNTTFTAESTAPYCIRVNVSGVDFGDNYSDRKLELYGTYELDGIIYDNKLGEISNQTSWTLEYDASQEAEPWTKIPDDSLILLRLVADNGNRTSDKTIIINCQSSYEAYVIEHIPEEEKEKSETYTGKDITINGAPEGAPFSQFDLKGNTDQQTYTGKNLANVANATAGYSATTQTVSNKVVATGSFDITESGSYAGLWSAYAVINVRLSPNTQYTLTRTFSVVSGTTYTGVGSIRAKVGNSYTNPTTAASLTFTTDSTGTVQLLFYSAYNQAATTTINTTVRFSNVQLEQSSSATSFEPYVGGVSAPNPDYPQAVNTVTGRQMVKVEGKNLLNIQDNIKASDDGLTFSYQNGAITASGAASPNSYANVTNVIDTWLQAGAYTLSISSALTHRVYLWVRYSDGTTGALPIINAGNTSAQATFAKDVIQMRLDFSSMTIGAAINETFSVQLEKGSTATAYEPYQGQSYEVNLGKNLLDEASVMRGYELNGATGAIVESANWWVSDIIPVKPNTPYTSSGWDNGNTNKYWYRSDNSYIKRTSEKTVTSPSDAAYMRVNGRLTQLGKTIMVEQGSTATSYAAYFTPIELCKIGDYQDYIYKSGDKWYVHKATGKRTYTADDITIAANDTYSNVRYAQFSKVADNKQYGNYTYGDIINFFTHGINMGAVPAGGWNSYISDGLIYNSAMQDNYWCSFSKSTVLATMKEKLNGMVAYYVLATPTDTEITNAALIAQLEAVLAARTYAGTNNIFTITPNEQGTLEIQYYTKWQNTSPAILSANGRNGTGNFKQIRRIGTK